MKNNHMEKKITMNKKGVSTYMFILFVITLIAIGLIIFNGINIVDPDFEIGSHQQEVIDEIQRGNELLLRLDTLGKYAYYEAVYNITEKFHSTEECGNYRSVAIFLSPDQDCLPSNELEAFENIFEEKLNQKAQSLVAQMLSDGTIQDYVTLLIGDEITEIRFEASYSEDKITAEAQDRFVLSEDILQSSPVLGFTPIPGAILPGETSVSPGISISGVDLSTCELTQFTQNSQSIGPPNNGRLVDGVQITDGEYVNVVGRREGVENFGTVELVTLLEKTGCFLKLGHGIKLNVWDLSSENGGVLGSHDSHQSGRDVDVEFICNYGTELGSCRKTKLCSEEMPINYRSHPLCSAQDHEAAAAINGDIEIPPHPGFNEEVNWEIIKFWDMESHVDVKFIFLHKRLIESLEQYARSIESDQELLNKYFRKNDAGAYRGILRDSIIRDERGIHEGGTHHDHFHLRINCPEGDIECID